MIEELDRAACERLASEMLRSVRAFQLQRPRVPLTTCEVMQALAWTVAPIVAVDPVTARAWFDQALDSAIDMVLERQ